MLSILDINNKIPEKILQRDMIHKDIYGIVEVIPRPSDLDIDRDDIWNIRAKQNGTE